MLAIYFHYNYNGLNLFRTLKILKAYKNFKRSCYKLNTITLLNFWKIIVTQIIASVLLSPFRYMTHAVQSWLDVGGNHFHQIMRYFYILHIETMLGSNVLKKIVKLIKLYKVIFNI